MDETNGYTHADAFATGRLQVSELHNLHFAQYGKPDGKTVLFLHGGPGGGTSKSNTLFFNPSAYRVVLLDQRGAGKSTPYAEIKENTTQLLLQDIEALRTHLQIPKWHMVFGGSWGSTLALAYAQAHPDVVGSLVVRGVWFGRDAHLSQKFFPDAYADFLSYLPPEDREQPLQAFYKLLQSPSRAQQLEAAKVWNRWELTVSSLSLSEDTFDKLTDEDWCLAHARLETHYFCHDCFVEDGQFLKPENINRITHIPTAIVQGRYDLVCPPTDAWDLHKALPGSKIYFNRDSGHTAGDPGNVKTLIQVCDEYSKEDF